MATLNISKDFSRFPTGRFKADAPGSNGEEFRECVLKPKLKALKDGETLTIVLDDGVEGYGSSFLVEGFAGLVKYGYFESLELLDKIEFSFSDSDFEFYKDKITQYVTEADFKSAIYSSE